MEMLRPLLQCGKVRVFNLQTPALKRPFVMIETQKGILGCKYVNVDTANQMKDCVVVFSGISTPDDIVERNVEDLSEAAKRYGIKKGMRGSQALQKLL